MAITAGGACGNAQSNAANQATFTINFNTTVAAGKLVVLIFACDNNATVDGDEGAVSSITSSAGTWLKAKEHCNSRGALQGGATCSIWYCVLQSGVTSSNSITLNLTNSAARDACAATMYWYNIDAAGVVVDGTNQSSVTAGAPGSLDVTTANAERLRVRGIAGESNSTTALTVTTNWTAFTLNGTTGGSATNNIVVRGEFRIVTATTGASAPTYASVDQASAYVAFREGATTNQAVTATPISPTASITKSKNTAVTVQEGRAVSIVRTLAVDKIVTTTTPAPGVTVREQTSKIVFGVVATSALLAATGLFSRVYELMTQFMPMGFGGRRYGAMARATGATFNQAITAAVSTTATLLKPFSKRITVALAGVLTITRALTKAVIQITAATSPVVIATRAFLKTVSATAASTATLAVSRAFLRTLSASATSTATMLRAIAKTVSATAASAVTMLRPKTIVSAITATVATARTLTKTVGKLVTATAASTATVTAMRAFLKTIAASAASTVTVAMLRSLLRTITATAASTVTLRRAIGKQITVAATSTASIVKSAAKLISLTRATTATVDARRAFLKTVASTTSAALTILRQQGKAITVTAASVATVRKQMFRTIAATAASTLVMLRSVPSRITVTATSTVTIIKGRVYRITALAAAVATVVAEFRTGTTVLNITAVSGSAVTLLAVTAHQRVIAALSSGVASVQAGAAHVRAIVATAASSVIVSRASGKVISIAKSTSVVVSRGVPQMISAIAASLASVIPIRILPAPADDRTEMAPYRLRTVISPWRDRAEISPYRSRTGKS